jgi:hypothetical protein
VELLAVDPRRVRELVPAALRVDAAGVAASAARDVRPGELVYVVVGDRAKVEKELQAGGFAPTQRWTVEDLLGPAPPP